MGSEEEIEVRAYSDDELRRRIESTFREYPSISEVFSDKLEEMIDYKADFRNEIVCYLAAHNKYSNSSLRVLEEGVGYFRDREGFGDIRNRLRNITVPQDFHSAYTELDLSTYYLKRGYSVELAPSTDSEGRKADLEITGTFHLFVEATGLWLSDFPSENLIADKLTYGLSNFGNFVTQLCFEDGFALRDIDPFLDRSRKWLEELPESSCKDTLPPELKFQRNGFDIASLQALLRTQDGRGGIGAVIYPGRLTVGDLGIREKLRKKQEQLGSQTKNAIVLETECHQIGRLMLESALYGNQQVKRQPDPKGSDFIRGPDRFFNPQDGTKVGVVVFFRRNAPSFSDCRPTAYLNHFANNSIPVGFFFDPSFSIVVNAESSAQTHFLKEMAFCDHKDEWF